MKPDIAKKSTLFKKVGIAFGSLLFLIAFISFYLFLIVNHYTLGLYLFMGLAIILTAVFIPRVVRRGVGDTGFWGDYHYIICPREKDETGFYPYRKSILVLSIAKYRDNLNSKIFYIDDKTRRLLFIPHIFMFLLIFLPLIYMSTTNSSTDNPLFMFLLRLTSNMFKSGKGNFGSGEVIYDIFFLLVILFIFKLGMIFNNFILEKYNKNSEALSQKK